MGALGGLDGRLREERETGQEAGSVIERASGRRICAAVALLSCAAPGWHQAQAQVQQQAQLEGRPLTDTVVIDGITCAPTGKALAEFYPSGRLAWCPIARDAVLFGHALPAMTWIGLTAEGLPSRAWLPSDTKLSGHLCHGTGYKGYSVEFHPTGALRRCFLAADTEIEGVPCIRGSFWTEIRGGSKSAVSFRENGTLAQCQASRAFTRNGIQVRKWQTAALDVGGRLIEPR
jgi:hypothetical protein